MTTSTGGGSGPEASGPGSFGGGLFALLAAGLLGILVGGGAVYLLRGGSDEAQVEAIVRNYILANPELLPEAMQVLDQRQSAAAIEPQRAAIETPYAGSWAGAQDGDVVLVEFFDYSCGYCRQSNAAVDRLIAEDPRLKVVYRELPVLGPDSQAAAFASMAAAEQGRFRQFHQALFGLGRPTGPAIQQALASVGVQAPTAPSPAQQRELQGNIGLAQTLRANGTPTFVVGDQVLHGAVGYEALRDAIAAARREAAS